MATTTTQNLLPGQRIKDDNGEIYTVVSISTNDNWEYTIQVEDKHSKYGKADALKSYARTAWTLA